MTSLPRNFSLKKKTTFADSSCNLARIRTGMIRGTARVRRLRGRTVDIMGCKDAEVGSGRQRRPGGGAEQSRGLRM